jgi:hypothetical protein
MKRIAKLTLACLVLAAAVAAAQQVPPLLDCNLECRAGAADVSVFTVPDGSGHPLSWCQGFGGLRLDASLELLILLDGEPLVGYPGEDMWLQSSLGGLVTCPGGCSADHATDAEGRTTFSGALRGGGHTDPSAGETLQAVVNGEVCASGEGADVQVNSPDLSGNLVVDLSDVVLWVAIYQGGGYDYAGDFYYDGVLDLSDVVMMSQGLGAACP